MVESKAIKIGVPKILRFNNDVIAKKYPILKKANDYTNGRLYKWMIIFHRNISIFLGSGSQMDRVILYDEGLFGNNDAGGPGHVNGLFFDGNSGTFNDASDPNSKKNNGDASNVSITNVGARGATMAFTVDVP